MPTERIGFEDEREAQRYYGRCPECGGPLTGQGSQNWGVCFECRAIYLELMARHTKEELIEEHRRLAEDAGEQDIKWDEVDE